MLEKLQNQENGIMRADVLAVRDAWIEAVQARDIDATVALYDSERGILCGTVDEKEQGPRVGSDAIREYFVHFLANDEVVAEFPPDEKAKIVLLSEALALYTGYYVFQLTKDGKTQVVNAKFTYLYEKGRDGKLRIIHHNSGLTPEGITTK